jgi:hypothetical protein
MSRPNAIWPEPDVNLCLTTSADVESTTSLRCIFAVQQFGCRPWADAWMKRGQESVLRLPGCGRRPCCIARLHPGAVKVFRPRMKYLPTLQILYEHRVSRIITVLESQCDEQTAIWAATAIKGWWSCNCSMWVLEDLKESGPDAPRSPAAL